MFVNCVSSSILSKRLSNQRSCRLNSTVSKFRKYLPYERSQLLLNPFCQVHLQQFCLGKCGFKMRAIANNAVTHEQTSISKRVIVVTSGKGGVGKTTVTANLGVSIARLGYKTLLIDADIGLRNLDLLLGMENRLTYTAVDVLENGCRLDQALVYDKRWLNLVFLAVSKNRQRYHITEQNMVNIVRAFIRLNYDFILIDCPAGIDVGFMNAIAPATESIIVTTPELPALRDADYVLGLLESNGIYNNKVLVNRVRVDMIQQYDMLSVYDAQETLGIPLLGAIPEDKTIISATNCGEPLVLQNQFNVAGLCFEMISRKLVGKNETVLDLNTPYKNKFEQLFSNH
jgi:septum site-determining protein MinD